jgi:hypothetical protein
VLIICFNWLRTIDSLSARAGSWRAPGGLRHGKKKTGQINDKEDKSVVLSSMWRLDENQYVDFPYFLLYFIHPVCDRMGFVSSFQVWFICINRKR